MNSKSQVVAISTRRKRNEQLYHVFWAVDIDLERAVALKILDPLLMQDATWVINFRREARLWMAKLEHAHIVPIHEIGEEAGRIYIAM